MTSYHITLSILHQTIHLFLVGLNHAYFIDWYLSEMEASDVSFGVW